MNAEQNWIERIEKLESEAKDFRKVIAGLEQRIIELEQMVPVGKPKIVGGLTDRVGRTLKSTPDPEVPHPEGPQLKGR